MVEKFKAECTCVLPSKLTLQAQATQRMAWFSKLQFLPGSRGSAWMRFFQTLPISEMANAQLGEKLPSLDRILEFQGLPKMRDIQEDSEKLPEGSSFLFCTNLCNNRKVERSGEKQKGKTTHWEHGSKRLAQTWLPLSVWSRGHMLLNYI